eukprot:scaffold6655_cov169-Amphora_coffeaeformis.AAC.30
MNRFLLLLLLPAAVYCKGVDTVVLENDTPVLSIINEHFLCYTDDWWTGNSDGWGPGTSILNMDFNNPKLKAAARALGPAIWRIGGSRADKIKYDMNDYGDESAHDHGCSSNWCLSRARWLEIIEFANDVNARIVFTLNYIEQTEKVRKDKDTIDGQDWDSSEARTLLELTKVVAPPGLMFGFELGNEITHGGLHMDLERFGRAYAELSDIIAEIWPDPAERPLRLGPATSGGGYDGFLPYIGPYLDILTYHKYQHSGKDAKLIDLVLEPEFLWKPSVYSGHVKAAYNYGVPEIWIGEGAMAAHSGQAGVTDTYLSTMWFANALGSAAKARPMPIATFCRQALIGGHYELLNQETHDPNPDFYMMRVWNELVGTRTLKAGIAFASEDNDLLRMHTFCGTAPDTVVLILVSIDPKARSLSIPLGRSRDVYQLEGEPGVKGQQILINGELQFMLEDGSLPELTPITENPEEDLSIPAYSVTFVVLRGTDVSTCDLNTNPGTEDEYYEEDLDGSDGIEDEYYDIPLDGEEATEEDYYDEDLDGSVGVEDEYYDIPLDGEDATEEDYYYHADLDGSDGTDDEFHSDEDLDGSNGTEDESYYEELDGVDGTEDEYYDKVLGGVDGAGDGKTVPPRAAPQSSEINLQPPRRHTIAWLLIVILANVVVALVLRRNGWLGKFQGDGGSRHMPLSQFAPDEMD